MRHVATYAVALVGLVALALPVVHADPGLGPQDAIYTKWLSELGVVYQDRVSTQTMIDEAHTTCAVLDQSPTPQTFDAAVNRLIGGPANFDKTQANGVVQAAIQSYCEERHNLIHG